MASELPARDMARIINMIYYREIKDPDLQEALKAISEIDPRDLVEKAPYEMFDLGVWFCDLKFELEECRTRLREDEAREALVALEEAEEKIWRTFSELRRKVQQTRQLPVR